LQRLGLVPKKASEMKTPSKAIQRAGRFLAYILGRHPDEFGLVPDQEGFVPV
jgi:RNA:NAD 2'-phosphotransferase (TPT1/KptA family)